MQEVLLFKTNITTTEAVALVSPALDRLFINRWHVDRWSEDGVLRLIADRSEIPALEGVLLRCRFVCQELEQEIVVPA